MYLGCIGDDFTGSSDLANTLTKAGFNTVQYNGVPRHDAQPGVEAAVVALKTRTLPVQEAVAASLEALEWLRLQGCSQFYFKYCSTFDSTPQGNIGPVLDAMMDALHAPRALVCPAFPATGRTVYQGHLFVNDRLLSESGMQNHPLTPMTDPDIRRWLSRQTARKVGHVGIRTIRDGVEPVRAAFDRLTRDEVRHIVVDTLDDADLMTLAQAARGEILISGASGLGMGLAQNFPLSGQKASALDLGWANRTVVALAGSCSVRTREQIDAHMAQHPARHLGADEVLAGDVTAEGLADWALEQARDTDRVPLIYSSADPDTVRALQRQHGGERIAAAFENLLAGTARALVERGVTRLITAGGETSGAIVTELGIRGFEIGPEIAPGVPVVKVLGEERALALKSGNFGDIDFFAKAAAALRGEGA
ncbi:3-oxo-tetronate kinase [Arvimicrobium flavum]|uniref:3-oxo-tetronate kinase n=1 Tax=Arvimicrobium flavum TaxID=3393320 RepID=UPI00237B603E|nr:3-oxo-tetronate kinase [Mesorhizobium shangrilense]